MDDSEAVEALNALGLSTYEARVFVALVRLGSGTARDVASITDVPRSQVYTTADDLESRGFISIRRSNPQVFHPVSLAEARARLERRFERRRDTAFDHLESVERTAAGAGDDRSEEVWSITGEPAVTERIARLVEGAGRTVLYGANDLDDPEPDLLETFAAATERGIDLVLLAEGDQPVAPVWGSAGVRETVRLPDAEAGNEYAERVLIVDFETFLLSVRGAGAAEETAVWSAGSTFARVFARLIAGSFPGAESLLDGTV
jgi:sugar-specific transcriptional regulator TrmB